MPLTTEFLHADHAKAAREALINVERLRLTGYFREAFEVCSALTRRGAWECPKAGLNYQRASGMMPLLAWLNGAICPQLEGVSSRTPAQLGRWAKAEQRDAFGILVMTDALQSKPAGAGWTEKTLEALPQTTSKVVPDRAIGVFLRDVDWVLKDRVRRALGLSAPELIREMIASMTPFRSSAVIDISPDAAAFEHGYLMEILHRCAVVMGAATYLGDRCLMLSVALDLAKGNRDAASARLGQWSRWLVRDVAIDYPLRCWEPYVELLRQGKLAQSLEIDEADVDTYLTQFRSRGPETWQPASVAANYQWADVLRKFNSHMRLKLSDPDEAEGAVAMLQHHTPISLGLSHTAKLLQCLRPGLSDAELADLQLRLGVDLPPSYRSFLQRSNGMFCGYSLSILPAEDVDWFRILDPDILEGWVCDDDEEATDEQYATYGPDQDCIHMRTRHLRSALQVSTSIDGDVLLLVPVVRFDDEWEAWFLGAKNPGAFRYRSFAEMMDETIFKWTASS